MLIRKMAGAAAACTAVVALALTGAASAASASVEGGRAVAPTGAPPTISGATVASVDTLAAGCWYSASHWWCNNVSGAPVYASSGAVVGYMYSNPSWFVCRSDNGGYVGGPHPNRWEWTQADNGNWGWMKDTAIYSETDPLPVCGV
ncbi:hypothetical protein [Streptomyces sp. NPDC005303]|uniref:hypothetical protein n=1 Tax=Streptomyces sp. NPDC005303 TaxID=3155713 RepID=UPI0033A8BEC7